MREIKFRAFMYEKGNPMVDGFMLFADTFLDMPKFWGKVNAWPLNCEVMQYTGLHDKNGREIYEGDIVTWCADKSSNLIIDREMSGKVGSVKWNRSEAGFEFNFKAMPGWYTVQYQDRLEVIGNIYENMELAAGEVKQ